MAEVRNQRIMLTKRLLKDGLLRLLSIKSLDKISVSELCAEAGINRATFYHHYQIPHDVLIDLEKDIIHDLEALSQTPASLQDARICLENICSYLKDHADLLKILIRSHTDADLARIFRELNKELWKLYREMNSPLQKPDKTNLTLASTFLSCGSYGMICLWLTEDIDKTPQEIVDLLLTVIRHENLC